MILPNLSNKKIAVWGAGKEGLAVRAFLKERFSTVQIIDITEDNTQDIFQADILIKSPGVSLYREEIKKAKDKGIVVLSGTSLFFHYKNKDTKVIAVTGTKGKSTTSSLIYHTLKTAGYSVELGGNIGNPLINLADSKADFIVAELSSYQCADVIGQADIAVLTNLYHEHLQWHGTHEQYFQDKLNLIRQAKQAILNATSQDTLLRTTDITHPLYFNSHNGFYVKDDFFYHQEKALFPISKLNLRGLHNAENACAVLSVCTLLKIDCAVIEKAFQTFQALPHRLEVFYQNKNLTCVDDSISTTPETTVAGIKAFDEGQFISVIVGGMDRGQDYTCLIDFLKTIKERCALITLPDTGIKAGKQAKEAGILTHFAEDMHQAVLYAKEHINQKSVIILSPGAPSYNAYKNFEEKGTVFQKEIKDVLK